MNYVNYVKQMGFTDLVVLTMLDMGYSQQEIADKMNVTRQTVVNIKNRNKDLKKAFKEEE